MADWVAILIAIALLVGNAFFVGAEFALISARRTQIEPRAAEGSWAARVTVRGMDRVSLMMAGAQLGITACSLGLGAIGEPAVAHQLEKPLAAIGITGAWLHGIAFAVALVVVVALHMILGEMVPKNIAIAGPERAALLLAPPLYGLVWILRPLIWLMNALANLGLKVLRVEPRDEVATTFSAEEVAGLVAESHQEGLLDEAERRVLDGSLTLSFETVDSVMVPRDELITLPVDVTPQKAQQATVRTGFSRFPLTDGDELVGYLHLKDFATVPRGGATRPIPDDAVRPLTSIPSGSSLEQALGRMQARGTHIALVRGEGGVVLGAAMLEDVIERLVGEVVDVGQELQA
ncbi:hemolysin family protein [Demequina sp. SYSU T00039]|uniref:Hemolysin family protein n=1 Tax=Demequina lignilytica TaxID=3051663 RepID=A0AAW7M7R5_9MICO|nr:MULTISPECIES: hemolysin family protein [unclassified Demequina]MDN4477062.1 hemolysin family protein [Demequina sp. SYSU T00039-1]MDN4487235.1 hemolysin family protein [Demequina sp. SYSU T00039]MDN4491770.1 hemolysin family protein [Demequina sp. SYSU T00068]